MKTDAVGSKPWNRWDALCLLLIALGHLAFTLASDLHRWPLHFDAYRDLAAMQNVLAGQYWCDASIMNLPPWYPPLFVWLHGSLSWLLQLEPHIVTSSSRFWLNGLILIAIYSLLRTSVSRTAALAGPVVLLSTSVWWLGHLTLAMPSIQGVVLLLFGLRAWHISRAQHGLQLMPAVFTTLVAWMHPINTIILAGVMTIDFLREVLFDQRERWLILFRHWFTTGVISMVLASPVILNLWLLPRINRAPYEYFGLELDIPKYAYQFHVLPAPLLGLAGSIYILWGRPELRWLLGYLLIGLVGQMLGYFGHAYGFSRLILVPHQFQWHTQIALTLMAVIFLDWILPRITAGRHQLTKALVYLAVMGAILSGLRYQSLLRIGYYDGEKLYRDHETAIDWIRHNTEINDTFVADPWTSYFIIGGYTGRKLLNSFEAHMNPAADVNERSAAAELFVSESDPNLLQPLIDQHSIDYILVTDQQPGIYPIVHDKDLVVEVFFDPSLDWRIYQILP